MAKYKHKLTGDIWTEQENLGLFYYSKHLSLPKIYVENSSDWEKIKGFNVVSSCPIDGDIYSVVKESTNEIFSIGDKVKAEKFVSDRKFTRIDKIYYNEHSQLSYSTNIGSAPKTFVFNDDTTKYRDPILITYDGFEIFNEGIPVIIYSNLTKARLYCGAYFKSLHNEFRNSDLIFFVDNKNALNWLEENKPRYSKKDMLSAIGYSRGMVDSSTDNYCYDAWVKSCYNTKK